MTSGARIVLALFTSVITGCALTPDYESPELNLPEAWIEPADAGASVANVAWFDIFDDPVLGDLVRAALDNNRDRAVARAKIVEASQFLRVARGDQFPAIGIGAGASSGDQSSLLFPGAEQEDRFDLSAGLSFEIDIWRRYSRATEAASADLAATEAGYREITIQLISEVAATYLLLIDLDARLEIARRTVAGRSDSLRIIEARFKAGTIPEVDVNQAQIQLAEAQAAAAALERGIRQTENALRVLSGEFPGPVYRGKPLVDWQIATTVPMGLPSELLQRRPDLVAAERILAAETARVGVAEALRWPSIELTGSYGIASDELSTMNSSEAQFWDIGLNLFAPVFNAGQLKAGAEAQRARAEQSFLFYEGAVRNAFREVEDALVAMRTLKDEHAARARQVIAARNAARLSRARYDGGTVGFLEVLDAERNLFDAELAESATRQAAIVALVRLYEALGGGWTN